MAAAVLAYALSPIDLIPDFIPILGLLDDFVIVPFGILLLRRLVPLEVFEDARRKVREQALGNSPTSLLGGAAILCLWLLLIGLTGWWIVSRI
ncbi:MAG: DUF1232 domain-containing protein [Gemmataceae bacterium]